MKRKTIKRFLVALMSSFTSILWLLLRRGSDWKSNYKRWKLISITFLGLCLYIYSSNSILLSFSIKALSSSFSCILCYFLPFVSGYPLKAVRSIHYQYFSKEERDSYISQTHDLILFCPAFYLYYLQERPRDNKEI